ncbi:hypothetical protein PG996_004772 [Apiospora saccharicola]|uniref:Rhodopsin domain-containing protein n=1 Tax=Apiospora saccharicola TaxID=335842 RepID=A0ABR1W532_9PEZI
MEDVKYALPSEEKITIWAVAAISAAFLVARVWIRVKSESKLRLDDYLVLAAWLMLLLSAVLWEVKADLLYWMYDVQYGRRPPSPDFVPAYATFMPCVFVWSELHPTCLWAVKFSFLVFFRRLGLKVDQHKGWWWAVFAITAYQCPKTEHVRYQDIGIYVNLVIDIITDLLILSIPFRMLWNVQIPLHKKVALLGVFSLTIVIMVVSVIRVSFIRGFGLGLGEQTATTEWLFLWSYVEMAVGKSSLFHGSSFKHVVG